MYAETYQGKYQITLSGDTNQSSQLGTYFYDRQENVMKNTTRGTLWENASSIVTLVFDNHDASASSTIRIVNYHALLNDVNENVALQQINTKVGKILIPLINSAKNSAKREQRTAEKAQLDTIEATIDLFKGRNISDSAY